MTTDKAVNPRDALAAHYFPKQWKKVAGVPGKSKRRQQLRRWAEIEQKLEPLRAAGSCCGNCNYWKSSSAITIKGNYCEINSDFYGYAITPANHLCTYWEAKRAQP